jgi:inner membrane protein
MLRELVLLFGIALIAILAYTYFTQSHFDKMHTIVSVSLFLLGLVAKEGIIRNILVSLIGCGLLYAGWASKQNWLMGFGVFVIWAPWLKHRGMTHTVWALILWGAMGWGLEKQLQIEGIMTVAILGYASHLFADTLTPNGVKWLYPLYKKSIKLPLS